MEIELIERLHDAAPELDLSIGSVAEREVRLRTREIHAALQLPRQQPSGLQSL